MKYLGILINYTLILLFTTSAFAGTYYVDDWGTSAKDNEDCGASGAGCSLSDAAAWADATNINTPSNMGTAMLRAIAGDTVYFRNGTYYAPDIDSDGYTPAVNPSNSGSEGSPITFIAYTGETPTIDNSINAYEDTSPSFGSRLKDWIIWDGFKTSATPDESSPYPMGKAVCFREADHCTLRNCDLQGIIGGQSNNLIIRLNDTDSFTCYNNKLYNTRPGDGSWNANSAAFQQYDSSNVNFYQNTIYNCGSAICDKRSGQSNSYYRNFIYDVGYCFYIVIEEPDCSDFVAYQNVMIDFKKYFAIHFSENGGNLDGAKFYNNTIYDLTCQGIRMPDDDADANDIEVFNNIVYIGDACALQLFSAQTPTYVDYNNYYGNFDDWRLNSTPYTTIANWRTAVGNAASFYGGDGDDEPELNSITTDPGFVNAGGNDVEDYKRNSYPTNGRGGSYPSVMGAYVTGEEQIGYNANGNGNGQQTITGISIN